MDTLTGSLFAFADMLPNIIPNVDNMRAATMKGYATATDLADYLVKKAYHFVMHMRWWVKRLAWCLKGVDLSELSLDELQSFSPLIECDVFDCLTLEGSLTARNHIGGTSPNQVLSAIKRGRERIINPKTA